MKQFIYWLIAGSTVLVCLFFLINRDVQKTVKNSDFIENERIFVEMVDNFGFFTRYLRWDKGFIHIAGENRSECNERIEKYWYYGKGKNKLEIESCLDHGICQISRGNKYFYKKNKDGDIMFSKNLTPRQIGYLLKECELLLDKTRKEFPIKLEKK